MQRRSLLLLSMVFAACGTLAQPGALDPSFNTGGSGVNGVAVYAIATQADGKSILGGSFNNYNGLGGWNLTRTMVDGSYDGTFDVGTGAVLPVKCITLQSDGKVLVGGQFNQFNGTTSGRLVRLLSNGAIDPTFTSGTGADGTVECIAVQPDGKILIGGYFSTYGGVSRNRLARLNADGTLDVTFTVGTGFTGTVPAVESLALQQNGKVLVCGDFASYNGTAAANIIRLNTNGTPDPSFNTGTGTSAGISGVALQSDGRVLIVGGFGMYNGTERWHVARLTSSGEIDASFDPEMGPNQAVDCLKLQSDGGILIGGSFTSYTGTQRGRLARLNMNGSLDESFDLSTGANNRVYALSVRPNGQVLIGGQFTSYNGVAANRVALLNLPTPVAGASVQLRALLEGPYVGEGLMNDGLRLQPSFPLIEPFTAMGYSHPTYVPGQAMVASLLLNNSTNAIVDWVIVELRSAASPATVIASKPALVQRDGDLLGLDGTWPIVFPGIGSGTYCPAIRPRNHLPIMLAPSAATVGTALTVDFTNASTLLWDNDARTTYLAGTVIAAGDINFNGTVKYTGSGNDRDPILVRVGSTAPNNTVIGYWPEDVNMDGTVKYTGTSNDRDRILTTVGFSTPSNMRVATLP